jgi:hypothetical protein
MVATSQIAQTTLRSLQEKLSGVRRGYARVRRA